MSDLIPIESVNAIEVFTGNGLDDLLARIRAEAVTLVPDLTTVASRKEIASQAYKVARSKTAIDDAGKALVADLKKQTGDIDAARKKARDTSNASGSRTKSAPRRKPKPSASPTWSAARLSCAPRKKRFVPPRRLSASASPLSRPKQPESSARPSCSGKRKSAPSARRRKRLPGPSAKQLLQRNRQPVMPLPPKPARRPPPRRRNATKRRPFDRQSRRRSTRLSSASVPAWLPKRRPRPRRSARQMKKPDRPPTRPTAAASTSPPSKR